jgi:cytochrome bd-type quinol oxidase subunit 2
MLHRASIVHSVTSVEGKSEARGVSGVAALVAIAIMAVASWVSWVGVGTACVNTDFPAGSSAAVVCEVELSNWGGKSGSTPGDNARENVMLALPLLIVLGGVAISRAERGPRAFWLTLLVAVVVLVAPWPSVILTTSTP